MLATCLRPLRGRPAGLISVLMNASDASESAGTSYRGKAPGPGPKVSSLPESEGGGQPRAAKQRLRKAYIVGVGMTKFEKPGRRENFDYPDMVYEAGTNALKEAGLQYKDIEQAVAGYCYGDTTSGQRAIYQLGMSGIPIYNVNNACSTGSTALMVSKQLVEGNIADCILAVGFEKMERGSIGFKYTDRANPIEKHMKAMSELNKLTSSPITAQMFANAGLEHMRKYGTKPEHFAKIAQKNHRHSVNNPNSQFRQEYSLEEILHSPSVHDFLTKLQCCPTSDGAACAIVASEDFVRKHDLMENAVEIVAQAMSTDLPGTFSDKSYMTVVGFDLTKRAAEEVYKIANIKPSDVDVIELHDCFSVNELLTYEALGLCPEGKAGEFIDVDDNTYGGSVVVNPSGGLISKGHPLGATGLAQCAELCWQLRGVAGDRQVRNAMTALQHNLGLGGAAIVTLYRLGFPEYVRFPPEKRTKYAAADSPSSFQVKPTFDSINRMLQTNGAEITRRVGGASFCFKALNKDKEGTWIVNCSGHPSVTFDPNGKGDVTIVMKDNHMQIMLQGLMTPQEAEHRRRMIVEGYKPLAEKIVEFAKPKSIGQMKHI